MTLTGGKLCGERGYTRGLERAPHYLEKGGNKSFGFDQILLVVQKLVEKNNCRRATECRGSPTATTNNSNNNLGQRMKLDLARPRRVLATVGVELREPT